MSSEQTESEADPLEYDLDFEKEKHGRTRWWHEDHLINQRTTWLLTSQGLLAGGFAFLRYRIAELAQGHPLTTLSLPLQTYIGTLETLANALFAIGFVSSLVSMAGIGAAIGAQRTLAKQYSQKLGVASWTTFVGQVVAISTPVLCALAWFLAFTVLRRTAC
jgi:hypothetical protein